MGQCPFRPVKPKPLLSRINPLKAFIRAREDNFAILTEKQYSMWLGETPVFWGKTYFPNDPAIVKTMLVERPMDFPKHSAMREALKALLGDSVFVTNGELWKRQRRIIDPSFEGGRLREIFPLMRDASDAMIARMRAVADGSPYQIDIETTHVTADVIFRTLFSIPITEESARKVYEAFGRYQEAAPHVDLLDVLGVPRWFPRPANRKADAAGAEIRGLLLPIIEERKRQIAAGTAPDDLCTAIMTTKDPVTGDMFDPIEMLDQVGIFFLAGHETSAAALAWTLYLVANRPDVQDRLRAEAQRVLGDRQAEFRDIRHLTFTRDVFREALRLYPPVAFFVRQTAKPEMLRSKKVRKGAPVILSPWLLHRHKQIWDNPDDFDPDRWETENGREGFRKAYIPFSAGARVCTGAAFAMQEATLILAELMRNFRFAPVEGREPIPRAQLTVRSSNGVWLRVTPV